MTSQDIIYMYADPIRPLLPIIPRVPYSSNPGGWFPLSKTHMRLETRIQTDHQKESDNPTCFLTNASPFP